MATPTMRVGIQQEVVPPCGALGLGSAHQPYHDQITGVLIMQDAASRHDVAVLLRGHQQGKATHECVGVAAHFCSDAAPTCLFDLLRERSGVVPMRSSTDPQSCNVCGGCAALASSHVGRPPFGTDVCCGQVGTQTSPESTKHVIAMTVLRVVISPQDNNTMIASVLLIFGCGGCAAVATYACNPPISKASALGGAQLISADWIALPDGMRSAQWNRGPLPITAMATSSAMGEVVRVLVASSANDVHLLMLEQTHGSTRWSLRSRESGRFSVALHQDGAFRSCCRFCSIRALQWLPHSWDYREAHPLVVVLHQVEQMRGDTPTDHVSVAMLTTEPTEDATSTAEGLLVDGPWGLHQVSLAHPSFVVSCTAPRSESSSRRPQEWRDAEGVVGIFTRPAGCPYLVSSMLRGEACSPRMTSSGVPSAEATTAEHIANTTHKEDFSLQLFGAHGEVGRYAVGGFVESAAVLASSDSSNSAVAVIAALVQQDGRSIMMVLEVHATRRTATEARGATSIVFSLRPRQVVADPLTMESAATMEPSSLWSLCGGVWSATHGTGQVDVCRVFQAGEAHTIYGMALVQDAIVVSLRDVKATAASGASRAMIPPTALCAADVWRCTVLDGPPTHALLAGTPQASSALSIVCAAVSEKGSAPMVVAILRGGCVCVWRQGWNEPTHQLGMLQWPSKKDAALRSLGEVATSLLPQWRCAMEDLLLADPNEVKMIVSDCAHPDVPWMLVCVVHSVVMLLDPVRGSILHLTQLSPRHTLLPTELALAGSHHGTSYFLLSGVELIFAEKGEQQQQQRVQGNLLRWWYIAASLLSFTPDDALRSLDLGTDADLLRPQMILQKLSALTSTRDGKSAEPSLPAMAVLQPIDAPQSSEATCLSSVPVLAACGDHLVVGEAVMGVDVRDGGFTLEGRSRKPVLSIRQLVGTHAEIGDRIVSITSVVSMCDHLHAFKYSGAIVHVLCCSAMEQQHSSSSPALATRSFLLAWPQQQASWSAAAVMELPLPLSTTGTPPLVEACLAGSKVWCRTTEGVHLCLEASWEQLAHQLGSITGLTATPASTSEEVALFAVPTSSPAVVRWVQP